MLPVLCTGADALPEIEKQFRYGGPASMPKLSDMLAAWGEITQAVNPWLEALTVNAITTCK